MWREHKARRTKKIAACAAKKSPFPTWNAKRELRERRKEVKELFAIADLCLTVAIPWFGTEHVVIRSAEAVGHATYKVAKDVGHAGAGVVKFVVK
jgi:hypothetical protein